MAASSSRSPRDSESFKSLTACIPTTRTARFYKLLIAAYKEFTARQKEKPNAGREAVPAVESVLQIAVTEEMERLESKLSFLATTANTAPFIGLFGTVWGIMDSFREIGTKGLDESRGSGAGNQRGPDNNGPRAFAAIPAVLGYNVLTNQLKQRVLQDGTRCRLHINLINR